MSSCNLCSGRHPGSTPSRPDPKSLTDVGPGVLTTDLDTPDVWDTDVESGSTVTVASGRRLLGTTTSPIGGRRTILSPCVKPDI